MHYWLRNLAHKSEVLAPGSGKDPVQFVDVRDVGRWVVRSVERRLSGVFNAAAPPLGFAEFLDVCRTVTHSDARLSWIDKDYLYSQGIEAFTQLPLWVPIEEDPGFFQISSEAAVREGFEARAADETISAAWRWYQSSFFNDSRFPRDGWGLGDELQAELLERWRGFHEAGA